MDQPTRPRPADPFASMNPFLAQNYRAKNIRSLSDALLMMPAPSLPGMPEWEEMYWRAWGMAWSNLRRPSPASGFISNYLNAIDSNYLHIWDAALCTQFGLYGRRAFDFMGVLNNFYVKQHGDGFICREINSENGLDYYHPFDPNSSGPNITTWVEWRYYRLTGDDSRFPNVFWPLLAHHNWLRENRSWPNGLYWATSLSSGMSNQNRVPGGLHHHRHWSWVDATMQASLNAKNLAQIAVALGENQAAEKLREEHNDLVQAANKHLWNEDLCFYQDVDPKGRFSSVKSIGAYWSLLDPEMIVKERLEPFLLHLRDPLSFNRPYRAPSLAANDDDYLREDGEFWRGGVWAPTNYMLLKGLRDSGQHRLAHEIALNHLDQVCKVFERTDTFWEYYQPESAAPGTKAKPHFVGWTGLSAIAMLIEDVIGIQVDWPKRQVMWDRRLDTDEAYGLRNFPLGREGILSLMGDHERIVVKTTVPFTLIIQEDEKKLQTAISAGETEIARNGPIIGPVIGMKSGGL